MEKVVYIVTGCGYNDYKVYTNKKTAEKVCEIVNYAWAVSGSINEVSVVEMKVVED